MHYRKQEEVLEKVRTGKVFADDPEVKPLTSAKKAKSQFEDRIKLIRDAETRLDELLMEKRQVNMCYCYYYKLKPSKSVNRVCLFYQGLDFVWSMEIHFKTELRYSDPV